MSTTDTDQDPEKEVVTKKRDIPKQEKAKEKDEESDLPTPDKIHTKETEKNGKFVSIWEIEKADKEKVKEEAEIANPENLESPPDAFAETGEVRELPRASSTKIENKSRTGSVQQFDDLIPSTEAEDEIQPMSTTDRESWVSRMRGKRQALIKKYAIQRAFPFHFKEGTRRDTGRDQWAKQEFIYHPINMEEQESINNLRAEIAELERKTDTRFSLVQDIIDRATDLNTVKQKVQEAINQPAYYDKEGKKSDFKLMVEKRTELLKLQSWLYYRIPDNKFKKVSVSDVNFGIEVAEFMENNPYPN